MYLDYSKLEFDVNGLPETPQLMSQELGELIDAENTMLTNVLKSDKGR